MKPRSLYLLAPLVLGFAFMKGGVAEGVEEQAKEQVSGNSPGGEALFNLCVNCHGNAGEGKQELEAPAIAGLPEWYVMEQLKKFANGGRGKDFRDVAGMRMRPMARTLRNEKEMADVSAYVANMAPVSVEATLKGIPSSGKAKYDTVCVTCHGANAEGKQELGAPPLTGASDWYLASQIHKFQDGIRGSNPALDQWGATMAPMSMTLTSEQEIRDVIAYIRTLGD